MQRMYPGMASKVLSRDATGAMGILSAHCVTIPKDLLSQNAVQRTSSASDDQ